MTSDHRSSQHSETPAGQERPLIENARRQVSTGEPGDRESPFPTASATDLGGLPESIGRYRIRRFISAGGMGRVYEADQTDPPRRVAIKVIKRSELSEKALQRFDYETRLLAQLKHPGIAQIYEVGTFRTPAGSHPYFSMEFVDGQPLTEYAAEHDLTTDQKLRLVLEVCKAVEHAHQKGIIHRDLKPGNIVVDSDGRPKILDFGVARAVDPDLQMTTMLTRVGEPVGTVPYMSPEQTTGDPGELDIRCDLYALAVVTYELLSGRLPYDLERRGKGNAYRVIREQEPDSLSDARQSFPHDLETILAKALEKEPDQRYQTVREFAEDVQRFLKHEPIRARRIGRLGRFVRWCRREPLVAAFAALSLVLLLVVAVGSTIATAVVEESRREAVQLAAQRRRSLYAARMNLAFQAFDRNEFATVRTLLQQQKPGPGQADLRGFEWFYLWNRTHGALHAFPGHAGAVNALAFSPDGRLLASGGGAGRIIIRRTRDWTRQTAIEAHDGQVTCLAFGPDGSTLATGGTDRRVKLWAAETGQPTATLEMCSSTVQCLDFSPDGSLLGIGAGEINRFTPERREPGELYLWSLRSEQPRLEVTGDESELLAVADLAFSPDGRLLAVVPWSRPAELWDVAQKKQIATLPEEHAPAMAAAFSPDGSLLAAGGWGKTTVLWDVSRRQVAETVSDGGLRAAAFTAEGRRLIVADNDDPRIDLWDVETGALEDRLCGHVGWVRDISVSPSGEWLASAGTDGTVRVWDLHRHHQPRRVRGHQREIGEIRFSRDGRRFATAGRDGVTKVWDRRTGTPRYSLGDNDGWDVSASLSPDGRLLAVVDEGGHHVDVWNLQNGRCTATLPHLKGAVQAARFSPDGRYLATAGPILCLWETGSWTLRWARPRPHHEDGIISAAFAPDGRTLATGGNDHTVSLWDVETGRLKRTLSHRGIVMSLEFSHDGQLLAAGCRIDGSSGSQAPVLLWETATWQRRHTLRGHKQAVPAVSFSPGGETLATGGGLGDVKFWDPVSGEQKGAIQLPHSGWTFGVAFSPDGRLLVCGNGTATGPTDLLFFEAPRPEAVPQGSEP